MMKDINKSLIKDKLISIKEDELEKAQKSCDSASSFKETDLTKQEGNLDTRAVEAGYLAGAYQKRVEELKIDLQMLKEIELHDFKDGKDIAIGALVELKLNDKKQAYFLSSTSGGSMLEIDNQVIMIISVFSPLGDAMLGLNRGDSFELQTPKDTREYYIQSVI